MVDGRVAEAALVDDAARWRILALIGAGLVLALTTWFSATAVLPDLRVAFGLSDAAASWLTNAVQIGFVVAALALSVSGLADALPTRALIATASLLAAASNLALLVAPDTVWLFVARIGTGMALGGVYPPALKLIATWFVRGRGLAMGATVGALTLGSSIPYLVKAVGTALDWRTVVATSSLAAATGAFLMLLFVREGPYRGARPRPDLRRIVAVVRDPALSLANLGYFGHMWELYAMWGWFLAFATEAERTRAGFIGAPLLTFVVIAGGALGCVAGGMLGDRIGRTATAALMLLASGSCALLIGFAVGGPPALFTAIAMVWGFTVIGDSSQFFAMVTELSEAETSGAALTLQAAVGFALTIVSIRLTPVVAAHIGWRWCFIPLAPGPFLGAVAMLALRRSPRARAIAGGRR